MITVVEPSFYWPSTTLKMFPFLMQHIERCGRVCYRSEEQITKDSARRFVEKICKNKHESVLEHFSITAIVVCSRACSHQLVRHRIGSYSMESQRYCSYKDRLFVICPRSVSLGPGDYSTLDDNGSVLINGVNFLIQNNQYHWLKQIESAFTAYQENGKAEDARYLLPNASKTELAVTYNVRQWKHFFKMRCSKHVQTEIREIATSIRADLRKRFPGVFNEKDSK